MFPIKIINNKARHNLINAKCRWLSDWLDGAGSFWEPFGQMEVMQICQGETQSHQGAITHEVCCLSAQLSKFLFQIEISSQFSNMGVQCLSINVLGYLFTIWAFHSLLCREQSISNRAPKRFTSSVKKNKINIHASKFKIS